MQSKYVLLCSPYKYQPFIASKASEQFIETELLSTIIPGTNRLTRGFIRYGLNQNYGIFDKHSLLSELSDLENGNYHAIDNVDEAIESISDNEIQSLLRSLQKLTAGKNMQGFDDCRIIDILVKAHSGKLITHEQFTSIFNQHTQRIQNSYSSWEQYLASCVLGKIFQNIPESPTVVGWSEYSMYIYGFCIAPTNIYSYGDFWPNHNLDQLTSLLQQLLNEEAIKHIQEQQNSIALSNVIPGYNYPSIDLLNLMEDESFNIETIDFERYQYLCDLAEYVFWKPLSENNLEWMISHMSNEEQSDVLLPKEFASFVSAFYFWKHYTQFNELHHTNIFAMFTKILNIGVLFSEEAAYILKHKLFGKYTATMIKWDDVQFEVELELSFDLCTIKLNNSTIINVTPAIDEINLNQQQIKSMSKQQRQLIENEWKEKMIEFLTGIPQRIKEFKHNTNRN